MYVSGKRRVRIIIFYSLLPPYIVFSSRPSKISEILMYSCIYSCIYIYPTHSITDKEDSGGTFDMILVLLYQPCCATRCHNALRLCSDYILIIFLLLIGMRAKSSRARPGRHQLVLSIPEFPVFQVLRAGTTHACQSDKSPFLSTGFLPKEYMLFLPHKEETEMYYSFVFSLRVGGGPFWLFGAP